MKKLNILILLIGILISFNINAQELIGWSNRYPKVTSDDMEKIETRKLIVAIAEPFQALSDHFKKNNRSDLEKIYEIGLEKYNKNMKAVFDKYWKYGNGQVLYYTEGQIDTIKNPSEYAVVFCGTGNLRYPCGKIALSMDELEKDSGAYEHIGDLRVNETRFVLRLLENKKICFFITMPSIIPREADILYAVRSIQYSIDCFKTGNPFKNGNCRPDVLKLPSGNAETTYNKAQQDKLKTKILLIPKELLWEGVTESDIKQAYPYPFKIVTKDEMDKFIIAEDPHYAYLWIDVVIPDFPDELCTTVKQILDAADGKQLSFSTKDSYAKRELFFTKDNFESFCKGMQ